MASERRQADDSTWTADDLRHFQKRLTEQRKRAVAQVAQFDDTLGVSEEAATESSRSSASTWPARHAAASACSRPRRCGRTEWIRSDGAYRSAAPAESTRLPDHCRTHSGAG